MLHSFIISIRKWIELQRPEWDCSETYGNDSPISQRFFICLQPGLWGRLYFPFCLISPLFLSFSSSKSVCVCMCFYIYIYLRVRACAAVHNKQSLTVLSHYPSEIRLLKGSTKREDSIRLCRMKRIRRENKREKERERKRRAIAL